MNGSALFLRETGMDEYHCDTLERHEVDVGPEPGTCPHCATYAAVPRCLQGTTT